jgi:hypothetical protein
VQELWRVPNNPTVNAVAAFNLTNSGASVALTVTCRVDSSLVGKALTVEDILDGTVTISFSKTFPSTAPVIVQGFSRLSARPFPIAYAGEF